jgi:hypothetical protein
MNFSIGPILITTDLTFYHKTVELIDEMMKRGSVKDQKEAKALQAFSELLRRKIWGDRQR